MTGRPLVAAAVLVWTCALVACTTGTTPDCSDAQCLPVLEVGGDAEAGSLLDADADAGTRASDGGLDGATAAGG